MNLFELFVKIGAKDEASGTISKITSGLGKGLATAAKIGTAAVGAAASGITALTTAAVNNYAEYEQLVGGVETLFKTSSDTVMKYAENAYKTAGMSANEYMATVTGFSAAMIQSLGGDTAKAAELSNMALTDMSDNANKMGSDLETLKTAYAGFSKQNYTMLDNLKLGYGGTKTEMERLIKDAAKLDKSIDANDMSFANIVKAINVVQTEMGITGTTALEAGRTISGSVGAMKSAWTNLVTGFADGSADIGGLINNLVTTIVGDGTENNLGVIGNVLPAIETALGGIAKLIEGAAPKIIEILPGLVDRVVPSVISAATGMVDAVIKVVPDLLNTVVDALIDNAPALIETAIVLVQSLIQGIQDNYQILVDGAIQIVTQLATGILNMLPKIVQLGLNVIVSLTNGIAQSLPSLLPTAISVIMELARMLTDPVTLTNILNAAMAIVQSLVEYILEPGTIETLVQAVIGIVDSLVAFLQKNLSPLLSAAIDIIMSLVDYILTPENLAMLVETAVQIVVTIAGALIGSAVELKKASDELISKLIDKFKKTDWKQLGKAVMDGMKKGMENAWKNLKEWFSGLFKDIIGVAKKILGIKSPSRVFRDQIGKQMVLGLKHGWDDNFDAVKKDINNSLDFNDVSVGVGFSSGSIRKSAGSIGGTTIGNITINIDGAKYEDETVLAMTIAETIQNMADRRAAAYA